jgi:hypothetical protein
MAGNLGLGLGANAGVGPGASATYVTSLGVGSGHSLGGGDYVAGTPIYASVFTKFNTSAATIVASGQSVQTFTATGFGPGDFADICSGATTLPQGIVMQVWLSAASQGSIAFSNLSGATTTVPVTTVIVELLKIAP